MNASPHRQAILVFGIVVPVFLLALVCVGVLAGRAKMKEGHRTKVAALEQYQTAKTQAAELEAYLTIDSRRDKTAYWKSKLEQDVVESLTKNLDKILAKYDSDTLRQTEMGQAPSAGGIGPKTSHPHSKMQLRFEGGFKPMQLLLAELETEMPHLVLESISINPKSASSDKEKGTLQFGLVYHCWEMPKKATPVP